MIDFLRKLFMASAGKIDEVFSDTDGKLKEYADRGEGLDSPHVELAKKVFDKAGEMHKDIQKWSDDARGEVLDRLGLASKEDVDDLRREVKRKAKQEGHKVP